MSRFCKFFFLRQLFDIPNNSYDVLQQTRLRPQKQFVPISYGDNEEEDDEKYYTITVKHYQYIEDNMLTSYFWKNLIIPDITKKQTFEQLIEENPYLLGIRDKPLPSDMTSYVPPQPVAPPVKRFVMKPKDSKSDPAKIIIPSQPDYTN